MPKDNKNRSFTADERAKLAKEGKALPDGSFPIVTEEDLRNAIAAFGRATDKVKAKAHIIKRAKALGKTDLLPADWQSSKQKFVSNHLDLKVDANAVGDEGDGVVQFTGGLTISDESEQVNGTRYDHSNTDLSHWTGEVFADHGLDEGYSVKNLIGTAYGVTKEGGRIFIEGIKYAMKNPLAKLYHDMMVSGHSRNFSVGTRGPEPDDNGVYKGHEIHELSQVGLGNNLSARAGEVVSSFLNKYEEDGMDVSDLRELVTNNKGGSMAEDKPKNQDAGDSDEKDEEEGTSSDESTEESTDSGGDTTADDGGDEESDTDKVDENSIAKMVDSAVSPIKDELKKYKQAFDEDAKEPEWNTNGIAPREDLGRITKNDFGKMDKWELAGTQFLAYCNSQKGDADSASLLNAINTHNLDALKKNGMVKNTITLSDFGNFVVSPELQSEVEGYLSDFSEVLRAFPYQQTNSRDFSWLTRSGDINLQDVDGIDDAVGTDTEKPVDEYAGSVSTSRLQEMAAVTPISTTANLFSAVDLIRDATLMYRNAYDRRLAQLIVARLEQAMEADATRSVSWDTGSSTNAEKLTHVRQAVASVSQGNGVLLMNEASYFLIWDLLVQSGSGNSLTETIVKDNPVRNLWGRRVVVAPNELMPTLDDSSTYVAIPEVRPLAGGAAVTVTVNHGIVYVDPNNLALKTNGGLRFDVSDQAAYSDSGTFKSSFQRNEVLLRGHFFRGGAVKDPSRVRGVRAENVIS